MYVNHFPTAIREQWIKIRTHGKISYGLLLPLNQEGQPKANFQQAFIQNDQVTEVHHHYVEMILYDILRAFLKKYDIPYEEDYNV